MSSKRSVSSGEPASRRAKNGSSAGPKDHGAAGRGDGELLDDDALDDIMQLEEIMQREEAPVPAVAAASVPIIDTPGTGDRHRTDHQLGDSDRTGAFEIDDHDDLSFNVRSNSTGSIVHRDDGSMEYSIDQSGGKKPSPKKTKDNPAPQLPTRIGDYQIGELLGSGGMGHVYVAHHVRMQRKVALKVLPEDLMSDEDSIAHFYEEVRAAGRLMHPNIVTALDAGEDNGIHYLVMEFVDGVTLTTLVAAGGPQSIGAASGIIRQAAMGLLHAHRAGLIHRDVKPGNIMRCSDGTIKLLDMGLAQVHRPTLFSPEFPSTLTPTQPANETSANETSANENSANETSADEILSGEASVDGTAEEQADPDASDHASAINDSRHVDEKIGRMLVGTLPYMAPEQLERATNVDYRADIYSLGATLHFLLTGRTPYSGPYIDQVYGHRHGPIPNLMTLRDDVDMNFAHIFERMMAKSPDNRYQSLDEVVESLAPYAKESTAPDWLSDFTKAQSLSDVSTFTSAGAGSLHNSENTAATDDNAWTDVDGDRSTDEVLGIDFGMFHASAAACGPDAATRRLGIESESTPEAGVAGLATSSRLFRCMIASDDTGICVGNEAMQRRSSVPQSVVHCVPLYIGYDSVPRPVAGRRCPPEALIGLMLRQIAIQSMHSIRPSATAVTVLGSYDQLHRKSILQSALIANLPSVRLIDRSLACVTAMVFEDSDANKSASSKSIDSMSDIELIAAPATDSFVGRDNDEIEISASSTDMMQSVAQRQYILFVGLGGQGVEAAVLRTKEKQLKQLSVAGHWSIGSLVWLQRLVDLAATAFRIGHNVNVKKSLATAAKLQVSCEKAMLSMSVLPQVTITVDKHRVTIERADWLAACEDLIGHLRSSITDALKTADRRTEDLDKCVMYGPLLRIRSLRRRVLGSLHKTLTIVHADRDAAARGAALCVSSQLPARRKHPFPPRSVASQSLGLVIVDAKQRRRILPIVTRGTMLPSRSSRRITVDRSRQTMTITVAETSGTNSRAWQTLGKHEIDVEADTTGSISRTLSFEVDINGILTTRLQGVGGASSIRLDDLPRPKLTDSDLVTWRRWVAARTAALNK